MSGWRCRYCGHINEAARGLCESGCGTVKGGQCPGHVPEIRSAPFLPKRADVKRAFKGVDHNELADGLREGILADIREEASQRPSGPKPRVRWVPEDDRHMLEACLFDLHVGKLAWAEETGSNYDSKIAVERGRDALSDLLAQARAYTLERILLPLGNDFFHYDTLTGLTTAGTPQDRDSRYQKMFRMGRRLASAMIRECAAVAPVEVLIVVGNHDSITSFHMGEVIEAEFASDPRVVIDNSPRLRKYTRYGSTLLGFTHGKDEPHAKLPLIMAQEVPDLWAATKYREIHTGHFHTSKRTDAVPVNSHNGVRVRVLQSLSGTDAWHASKGYVGEPGAAEGFVWNYSRGLRANLFSHPRQEAA